MTHSNYNKYGKLSDKTLSYRRETALQGAL